MGTASVQSDLRGAGARDWAQVQEGAVAQLYDAVLSKTKVGSGTAVLDVGCGAGLFCQMAAQRGAPWSWRCGAIPKCRKRQRASRRSVPCCHPRRRVRPAPSPCRKRALWRRWSRRLD
jgi:hypothetical protein